MQKNLTREQKKEVRRMRKEVVKLRRQLERLLRGVDLSGTGEMDTREVALLNAHSKLAGVRNQLEGALV